ncbi:ketol-acid reductoisomerase [Haladaptatus sp. GCM10025707]|uniref:ketol-acid reductoisomerase n=1 Tax=unclassified Haladaptatus TaxID=2622732 RepID=UPI0026E54CD5|nr:MULTISPECIES: ketol-acid reductoisomerase [unclassified Haladaptatus]
MTRLMAATETTIYHDADATLSTLDERAVAIIGYGNQGRSQALNLRDSGVEVVVGNRSDDYRETVEEDGFESLSIPEAAAAGDIVCLLIPDEVAPAVYDEHIHPNLEEGDVLYFSHGYNITFDLIQPPETVDVVLVAPRMAGPSVRTLYEAGKSFPSIMAVEQDASGEATAIALALAKGIGSTQAGVVEGTFDMETKVDLLSEQALVPMMMGAFQAKFEVERAHGIPEEIIMSELYLSTELAEIFELMAAEGFLGQLPYHSPTSQYGQLSRADEFVAEYVEPLKEFTEEQLRNIDNGSFVREWSAEQSLDHPGLKRLYKKQRNSDFVQAEQRTIEKLFDHDED